MTSPNTTAAARDTTHDAPVAGKVVAAIAPPPMPPTSGAGVRSIVYAPLFTATCV